MCEVIAQDYDVGGPEHGVAPLANAKNPLLNNTATADDLHATTASHPSVNDTEEVLHPNVSFEDHVVPSSNHRFVGTWDEQRHEHHRQERQHQGQHAFGYDGLDEGEFHNAVMKAMLEDSDVQVASLRHQLEESERKVTSLRHRLDETLRKVTSLELQLQTNVVNASQGVDDHIPTEVEAMHDFINAMQSSALLESTTAKRARTELEGSRVSREQQEISRLRHELQECKRDKEAAMGVATEASAKAFAAKKACKDRQGVRRGTKGSSEPRGSSSYKRWFGRQVDILSKFIGDHFGKSIFSFPSSNAIDDGGIIDARDTSNAFDIRDLGGLLAALTKKHEGLLDAFLDAVGDQRGVNSLKLRLVEVEEAAMETMQKQLNSVAVLLIAHLGVSHAGYQTLINATSWTTGDGESLASRVRCPLGTSLCRWPSLNRTLTDIKLTSSKLGLTNLGKGAAFMDCRLILIDQLQALFKSGLIDLEEGITIWVQILGDATGIWRSLKMNGTTLVLKVI